MAPVKALADQSAGGTQAGSPRTIPFLKLEQTMSRQIVAALDAWRDMSEAWAEQTFLSVFGSPLLQAAVGIDPGDTRPHRKAG